MLLNLLIQNICNITEIITRLNSAGSKSHCSVVHNTEGQVQEAAEGKVLANFSSHSTEQRPKKWSMAYVSD